MCGRFTSLLSPELLAIIFGKEPPERLTFRYNIAPTQMVLFVRKSGSGECSFSSARWGLVPHWAKDPSLGSRMINARCETVHEKPAFRQVIRTRRCIVPASGFFEWQATPSGKLPYYVTMADDSPLFFAGIWDSWKAPDGTNLETCSILTTEANSLMAPIHDRMPVIINRDNIRKWLDPGITNPEKLEDLYQPYPAELMQAWRVSPFVNSPRNDAPACIERIAP